MTTISQPKRHTVYSHSSSGSRPSLRSFSACSVRSVKPYPQVFQGTDAVPQNQRVALQRVIDTHQALELKYEHEPLSTPTSTTSGRPMSSSSSMMSSEAFASDFSDIGLPQVEVRAFRYLLRLWDPNSYPADDEFDAAIAARRGQFEEQAIKHFMTRVALWHSDEKAGEGMTRSIFFFRRRAKSIRETLSATGDEAAKDDGSNDGLKKVTTREGLAQLVWTLLQDRSLLQESGLRQRCMDALKDMYHVTFTKEGGTLAM
ncbi:hypothetical protein ACJQWK_06655 [Exserohilum turcicum]|uniref:Uncharacterized protein n=1 Tax=Exserohilum turcicum (strain 28A) TaxID=671987 RepID=R0IIK0_EXST2|nr:uncharacterized protein SETTUDRAFT_163606 [Exserohilum turcica Et28A]EOA84761.1 hypothetical protein SETTUDRAFT_163606 [Exserohilum turcica Et28A]